MNHKQKVKLARRMRHPDELEAGISIFQTIWWEARKAKRLEKELAKFQKANPTKTRKSHKVEMAN